MTTDMKPEALLWIDTETTGLDPEHDQLLEIAIRCTDPYADRHHTSHRTTDCIQRDINEYRHTIQKETNQ